MTTRRETQFRAALYRRLRFSIGLVAILGLSAGSTSAATFVVNSTDDDSDAAAGNGTCSTGVVIILSTSPWLVAQKCTLRAAIEEANASAGADTIEFSQYLPTVSGIVEIAPTSALPPILDRVTLDGYSHPSYDVANPGSSPIINLLGGGVPAGSQGLAFLPGASHSAVYGLAIVDFPGSGILITPFFAAAPTNITIQGSHVGIWRGVFYRGNRRDGIEVFSSHNNIIGEACTPTIGCVGKRNVIASNDRHGVYIGGVSSANRVAGNYIGVDRFGSSTFVPFGGSTRNGEYGVYVDEDATANWIGDEGGILGSSTPIAAGNVISGNSMGGIYLRGNDNQVFANHIGTNASGTSALGNLGAGVTVWGDDNTIGNSGHLANVISGNTDAGIRFVTPSGFSPLRTEVRGNYIGTDASGNNTIGNGSSGIVIWGNDYQIWSNVIGGNTNGISSNGYGGVIARNYIGTNGPGVDLGNSAAGIVVSGGNDLIGGAGNGNTIGFNQVGIVGGGSSYSTTIAGNYIGTGVGSQDLGNTEDGIRVFGAEFEIGGLNGQTNGLRNVIGFNGGAGIDAGGFTPIIQGNFIGTNASGADMGNDGIGIYVDAVPGLVCAVGAMTTTPAVDVPDTGNVVAFNGGGIVVDGTDEITLRGNELFSNVGIGIDLDDDGETPNDVFDADAGTNRLQNMPVFSNPLTFYDTTSADFEIAYAVPTHVANASFPLTVDFYIHDPWLAEGDQARVWIGSDTYTAVEAGTLKVINLTPPAGAIAPNLYGDVFEGLRGTATDADGNTSELSRQAVPVPEPGFAVMLLAGGVGCAAIGRKGKGQACRA